jgi:short-subunit dehydrogenase
MNNPQRALVTGASSGLGRGLAIELLKNGYEVALVGRNEKRLAEIARAYPKGQVVVADLADESQFKNLYARAKAAVEGPFNLIVNCAGMAISGRIQDFPAEAMKACWNVNFASAVAITQAALPDLLDQKEAMVVNVTSGVGRRALPFVSPYCTAKAALISFSDSLRVEVAGTNIKVLSFSPGPVQSDFHQATQHFGQSALTFPPFHGLSAELVAHQLFQSIVNRRERVVLGLKAAMAHHMNYWVPAFTDFVVNKMYRIQNIADRPAITSVAK